MLIPSLLGAYETAVASFFPFELERRLLSPRVPHTTSEAAVYTIASRSSLPAQSPRDDSPPEAGATVHESDRYSCGVGCIDATPQQSGCRHGYGDNVHTSARERLVLG
jgi:hypothetical protein